MASLIFYKGSAPGATVWDKFICLVTKSKYSHVEMVFEQRNEYLKCWSSSTRDGGVRTKWIKIDSESWDTFQLPIEYSEDWFLEHSGAAYDFVGLLGTITKKEWFSNSNKWFCSECIAEVLGIKDSWKYSPQDLYLLVK